MIANYGLAVSKSIEVLEKYGYNEVPIALNKILKELKRTIRICSYTKFSKQYGLSIEEVCQQLESDEGACVYERQKERYIIFYNDTIGNYRRIRFTIAHELGHFFLGHHKRTNTSIMHRKGISLTVYNAFENEANCFARNLLSPYPLVPYITDITQQYSVKHIMEAFDISHDAAIARRSLFINDGYRITKAHKEYFKTYRIKYDNYCSVCGNAEVPKGPYCKICGKEYNGYGGKIDRFYYDDGFELDEEMRAVKCPRCGSDQFDDFNDRCSICGTYLHNHCHGASFNMHDNAGNARFCEKCGASTYYKNKKLLKDWREARSLLERRSSTELDDRSLFLKDALSEVAVTVNEVVE